MDKKLDLSLYKVPTIDNAYTEKFHIGSNLIWEFITSSDYPNFLANINLIPLENSI